RRARGPGDRGEQLPVRAARRDLQLLLLPLSAHLGMGDLAPRVASLRRGDEPVARRADHLLALGSARRRGCRALLVLHLRDRAPARRELGLRLDLRLLAAQWSRRLLADESGLQHRLRRRRHPHPAASLRLREPPHRPRGVSAAASTDDPARRGGGRLHRRHRVQRQSAANARPRSLARRGWPAGFRHHVRSAVPMLERATGRRLIAKAEFLADLRTAIEGRTGYAAGKLGNSELHWLYYPIFLDRAPDALRRRAYEASLIFHAAKQSGLFPPTAAFLREYVAFYLPHVHNLDCVGLFQQPDALEAEILRTHRVPGKLISHVDH